MQDLATSLGIEVLTVAAPVYGGPMSARWTRRSIALASPSDDVILVDGVASAASMSWRPDCSRGDAIAMIQESITSC